MISAALLYLEDASSGEYDLQSNNEAVIGICLALLSDIHYFPLFRT